MKWSRSIVTAVLFSVAFLAPTGAHAFGFSGFGGRLGYVNPEGVDSGMQFGAHAEFERPGSRVHLLPSVMYWSEDGLSTLSGNADLYYHFNSEGLTTPYIGAGLGVFNHNADGGGDETNLGVNLFGGLRFPAPGSHLFVEGRYAATELSQFSLLGGVTFHTSR